MDNGGVGDGGGGDYFYNARGHGAHNDHGPMVIEYVDDCPKEMPKTDNSTSCQGIRQEACIYGFIEEGCLHPQFFCHHGDEDKNGEGEMDMVCI